jgi:predicted RND superfamily exporter protein
MWAKIGSFILRYRFPLALLLIAGTFYMGWNAQHVRMSYKFNGVLPDDDSTKIAYQNFLDEFGEDGNVLAIGYKDPRIWELKNFQRWRQLVNEIRDVQITVDGVAYNSVFNLYSCLRMSLKHRKISTA